MLKRILALSTMLCMACAAQAVVLRPDRYVLDYVGQDAAHACGTIAQIFHTVYPQQA